MEVLVYFTGMAVFAVVLRLLALRYAEGNPEMGLQIFTGFVLVLWPIALPVLALAVFILFLGHFASPTTDRKS